MDEEIAQVEEHELRSVWPHEEHDFTRWLMEHLHLLAAELGIEVEEVTREEAVGDFSADIVAKEMNTGGQVVIENQYGATDHDHLGKLLTYSAGRDAAFTIWVAEEFRAEHRSVLEWLNESGPQDARFFAVKPRVLTIEGNETRGFEFEVLVEPNDWERQLTQSLTETEKAYKEFFADLTEAYAERRPDWYQLKPQPQSWLSFGAGMSGVSIGWVFHQGPEFSLDLYIDTSDGDRNEAVFQALEDDRAAIEDALDAELVWERLPEKRACRIKLPREIEGRITELTAVQRNQLIEWGVDRMDEFQDEFEGRIGDLEVELS